MVAPDGVKPRLFEPIRRFCVFRAPIKQVANGNEAVPFRIEPPIREGVAKPGKVPMDVPHQKIMTHCIGQQGTDQMGAIWLG